jgi:hypothetical protein
MQRVTWQADENDSVPVANGYLIDEVTDRDVTFDLPAGTDCQQSRQTGASCVGRSQMVLSFSETAPAQAATPAASGNQGNDFPPDGNPGGQFGRGGGNDIGAIFEAANAGDEAAAEALQEFFGNRGRGGGGRGGGGGGRGGRGGGNGEPPQ